MQLYTLLYPCGANTMREKETALLSSVFLLNPYVLAGKSHKLETVGHSGQHPVGILFLYFIGHKICRYYRGTFIYHSVVYNIEELKKYGFHCPMTALPINIPFEDYKISPASAVVEKYKDGYINIIFVGRIAPNKRQEKVIEDFYCYHERYNPKSRLILVGNYGGMERYYLRLKKFVAKNHIEDVIFTGHIPFDEILAYYSVANLFLCESMHEGFCVPLVESMIFNVPVLAYNSSAIAETLGTGGIVHTLEDSAKTAELMNGILTDAEKQQEIKENQKKELERFDEEKMTEHLLEFISKSLGNKNG